MTDLFYQIIGLLGITIIFFFMWFYIGRIMNPFIYKITYINKKGKIKILYVRMINELSLTSYKEIKENIQKEHPNTDVNIERIYYKKYNNIQLFNKKDYD